MINEDSPKRHIVIVDDEPVNLDLAENALNGRFKLTKLISGKQLLKFLSRVKPDMILLDVQMPEMNGYEVMKNLSENPETKDIPVIFLTGQDGVYSEREGFRLGAKDFIKKPFDNEIMLSRINSQIELYTYRTRLEDIIAEQLTRIAELQHVLTVGWAEIIESRDGTTGSHVRNTTACYEVLINAISVHPRYEAELMPDSIGELLRASTLHDIGKIGISDVILKKPGPLDKEEFAIMKCHSQIGADMIGKIIAETFEDGVMGCAKNMALYHHERWDGTGYPCGLKGEEIPLYVRVLSIADVYEALTAVRPYKRAFSHEEALEIMRGDSGKFFDPGIFEVFMEHEQELAGLKKRSANL